MYLRRWQKKRQLDHMAAVMSELLRVCFTCTVRLGESRDFIQSDDVEELFGYQPTTLGEMCASDEDSARASAFLDRLQEPNVAQNILRKLYRIFRKLNS